MGQSRSGGTLSLAHSNVLAVTVLGSILGLIALQLELISLPLMLVWCAAAMFLCGWLALGEYYQGLLIGVTLAIVVGSPTGEINTALWRSGDVILGSLLAMLFTGIWPQRAFIRVTHSAGKSLASTNRIPLNLRNSHRTYSNARVWKAIYKNS